MSETDAGESETDAGESQESDEEPSREPAPSRFFARVHVEIRGDIVQWFRELYKRCERSDEFEERFMDNPTKAILGELSDGEWSSVPSEDFEPQFDNALQDEGHYRLESMRGPLDPEPMLDFAERVYKDDDFAKDFRRDPVGLLNREVAEQAVDWKCKVDAKHNWKCEGEVSVEHGFEW